MTPKVLTINPPVFHPPPPPPPRYCFSLLGYYSLSLLGASVWGWVGGLPHAQHDENTDDDYGGDEDDDGGVNI